MSNITKLETVLDPDRELIRKTLCKEASDADLDLFSAICKRTGLDPFTRQIYLMPRREKTDRGDWITKNTVLVSIDGLRLVAERTGSYSPGREPSFVYDESKSLVYATSYIKKMTKDGTWHEISASAYYSEYAQTKKNKETGKGEPTTFWQKMPHIMLAKCAEALALRRAFPAELSGIYTSDEIPSAEDSIIHDDKPPLPQYISSEQAKYIEKLCDDPELLNRIMSTYNVTSLMSINAFEYDTILRRLHLTKERSHARTGS